MSSTRRSFMQKTVLAAAAAAFPVTALAQVALDAPVAKFDPEQLKNLDGVTAETFEKWIGGQFRLSLNGQKLGTVELIKVRDLSKEPGIPPSGQLLVGAELAPTPRAKVNSFLLVFERTGGQLPQETYTVDHDWLGTFPLLLVPSGAGGNKTRYTVSFASLEAAPAN